MRFAGVVGALRSPDDCCAVVCGAGAGTGFGTGEGAVGFVAGGGVVGVTARGCGGTTKEGFTPTIELGGMPSTSEAISGGV